MTRRITAAFLALVMLFCAFPIGARAAFELEDIDKDAEPYMSCPIYEEGRLYYEGEYVWVYGKGNKPLQSDVEDDCKWKDLRIKRCGEGKLQHPMHTEDCYEWIQDEQGNETYTMTCGLEEHEHETVAGCMGWYAYCLFQVVSTTTTNPTESTESTEPVPSEPSEPDVDDGYDEPAGSMFFEVLCVNAKGEPLPDVSFGLATVKTDDTGNVLYHPESGDPMVEEAIYFKTTNSEGKVRFDALENYLTSKQQPWVVYQDAAAFAKIEDKVGKYYNQYHTCDTSWIVNNGLQFSIGKQSILEREESDVEPGFSNGVLTYVNERVRCQIDVNVKFVDENGDSISGSSCEVTVTPEQAMENFPKVLSFPLAQSTRNDPWGDSIYGMQPGKYTLESDEPADIEGYAYVNTTYELLDEVQKEWVEGNSVELGADLALGTFRITHHYERGVSRNRISVKTVDENNEGCSGATYTMFTVYGDQAATFTNADATFEIISADVMAEAMEGETVTLYLQQTEAPHNHHLADEFYELDVTMEDGVVSMALRDENGSNGAVDGIQTAVFTSQKQDLSNTIIIRAAGDGADGYLTGGEYVVYENDEPFKTYTLDESVESYTVSEFTGYVGRTFTLKQSVAPAGYLLSEESYTIEVISENGTPKVVLTKNENPTLRERIANVFGMSRSDRGDFGEQIAQFYNEKAPTNIIIMKAYEDETEISGAEYALKDASDRVIVPDIKTGTLDMSGYGRKGETLVFKLEQTKAPGYMPSENIFQLTVQKEGNTVWTTVVEVNGDGSNVETSTEGHIVKFRNQKPEGEAQIYLTLQEVVTKWGSGTKTDAKKDAEVKSQPYEFVLTWLDGDTVKEETVAVSPKKEVQFKAKLPLGTEYTVSAVGDDNPFRTTFTGKYTGTVEVEQLGKVLNVTATNTYDFTAGSYDTTLYMIKVNARDRSKTLSGAKFVLKKASGAVVAEFITTNDGAVFIQNLEKTPAAYTLKETVAPEDYVLMKKVIDITVDYTYEQRIADGKTVLVQNLQAMASTADSKELEQSSDGTYYIKNTHVAENPKTGDSFNGILWAAMLTTSALGLSVVSMQLIRKRRRVR